MEPSAWLAPMPRASWIAVGLGLHQEAGIIAGCPDREAIEAFGHDLVAAPFSPDHEVVGQAIVGLADVLDRLRRAPGGARLIESLGLVVVAAGLGWFTPVELARFPREPRWAETWIAERLGAVRSWEDQLGGGGG